MIDPTTTVAELESALRAADTKILRLGYYEGAWRAVLVLPSGQVFGVSGPTLAEAIDRALRKFEGGEAA